MCGCTNWRILASPANVRSSKRSFRLLPVLQVEFDVYKTPDVLYLNPDHVVEMLYVMNNKS